MRLHPHSRIITYLENALDPSPLDGLDGLEDTLGPGIEDDKASETRQGRRSVWHSMSKSSFPDEVSTYSSALLPLRWVVIAPSPSSDMFLMMDKTWISGRKGQDRVAKGPQRGSDSNVVKPSPRPRCPVEHDHVDLPLAACAFVV
jgi:hypothetical protein